MISIIKSIGTNEIKVLVLVRSVECCLFVSTAEEEDDAEESAATKFDKLIMPDYVFCLEATEEFLRNRVMNLPESVVHGTHNDEEGLMKRLELYRSLNNDEETVLNYFDEKEFHPEKIDVTKDDSPMMRDTVERIKKTIGEPRNYGKVSFYSTAVL